MSQFDQDCITYTQDGRILQIEYAAKCVETAETIVGVKCADGVVLAAQKLIFSKLLVENTNRRIFNIEQHIGMAIAGKIPDGRHLMSYGRTQSAKYKKDFDTPISGHTLANRLSLYLNAHTLYNSVRPFGTSQIISSYSKEEGFQLFMLEPSGNYYGYTACTAGKGRQMAKAQFQKTDFSKLKCEEALFYLAKIMIQSHEDATEKKYEIEMSWISEKSGFKHQNVPSAVVRNAQEKAAAAIEQEQMG